MNQLAIVNIVLSHSLENQGVQALFSQMPWARVPIKLLQNFGHIYMHLKVLPGQSESKLIQLAVGWRNQVVFAKGASPTAVGSHQQSQALRAQDMKKRAEATVSL